MTACSIFKGEAFQVDKGNITIHFIYAFAVDTSFSGIIKMGLSKCNL